MGGLESRKLQKDSKGVPQHAKVQKAKKGKANKEWAKKMKDKEKLQRVKDLSKQLKAQIQHESDAARAARRANRIRKVENEKNSMVTQKISNIKAVKKLSPKQRRKARIFLMNEL